MKLGSISSSLTGATVTQPAGAPPAVTVDLGAVNPNDGDKITFNFNLPDGTTESIALTATTKNPPPAGSFLIGVDTAATTANLQAALTTSIQTLSDTSLVAASAIAASDNFFNPSATVTGAAVNNQLAVPAPITGATLLSGAAATDSLAASFAAGDTITVNGTPITFVASGATGNQLNITDSVQTLLAKDRSDHRHRHAVDRHRRRGRVAWRGRREPDGLQFERGGVRGAGLQRPGKRKSGAVARQRSAVRHGHQSDRRHVRQHRLVVHGRTRYRSAARHRDRAHRPVDHGAVWRAPTSRRCAISCRTSRCIPRSRPMPTTRTQRRR